MCRHGLSWSASFNDVNGGSIRTIATCGESEPRERGRVPDENIALFERRLKIHSLTTWETLDKIVKSGQTIVGYGASTKGNTYLQYWGIGPELVQYIADRNKEKVGKWTPTGQEIISEERMRKMAPGYLLILPWHFLESFKQREQAYLKAGGRFIVPLPRLAILGAECLSTLGRPSEGSLARS